FSRVWTFLIGFFAPLIPAIFGLLYVTFIEPEGSSGAMKFMFTLMITPIVAFGILLIEVAFEKWVMMYGTLLSGIILITPFLVWLMIGISNM
ncbi:MAG: hypothetical protein VXZ47_02720, partial [Candidatus Thermoplasmatota archaeon]|nr:hypothetical protein [Candidatus Thermoplasmatota archaeon]